MMLFGIMSQMMPATARAMSTSAVCAAWRRLLRRRRTPKTTNNTASSTSTPTITNVMTVDVMVSSLNAPSWNRLTMTKATSATMGSVAMPPRRHRMPNNFTKTGSFCLSMGASSGTPSMVFTLWSPLMPSPS